MKIQLLALPWWEFGLWCLSIMFILLVGLFVVSAKGLGRSGMAYSGGFPSLGMDALQIESKAFHQVPRSPIAITMGGYNGVISTWVTRLFIAMVLTSAAIYFISQCPGFQSPFWLGLVLQGFTYGSAYLFYVSGGDESTDC